jgi:hypothetical protein
MNAEKTAEQAAAFQRVWLDSMSKMMQTAFAFGPETAPPEVLREIRSGMFQALAKSWEEFMRSPQFLEGMKQWMDQAVAFRKMSNDLMANVRHEMQATSREDVDTIMLTIRHMEQRLLDRMEDLAQEVATLRNRLDGESPRTAKGSPRQPAGAPEKPLRREGKETTP